MESPENLKISEKELFPDSNSKMEKRNHENRITEGSYRMSSTIIKHSPQMENLLMNNFKGRIEQTKCLEHDEEQFQFYCFDDNKLLCSECLVSNACTGHHVINLKRASLRIKRKLDELLCQVEGKAKAYELWEKRTESKREDLREIITNHKEHIIACMNDLRKRIEEKQEELLKEADNLIAQKCEEWESNLIDIKSHRKEIQSIRGIIEGELEGLDEIRVCQYFSAKGVMIQSVLEGETDFKNLELDKNTENKKFQEQFSLIKFQEAYETISVQLSNVRGIQDLGEKVTLDNFLKKNPERSPTLPKGTGTLGMKFPSPLLKKARDERNVLITNLDHIFKANKTPSPKKKATFHVPLSQKIAMNPEDSGPISIRTRSQNIHKILDRIFEAKSQRDVKSSDQGKGNLESNEQPERLNTETYTQQGNSLSSVEEKHIEEEKNRSIEMGSHSIPQWRNERSKSRQEKPVGHTKGFEKNVSLKGSFIQDRYYLKQESFYSPRQQKSPKSQFSSILSPSHGISNQSYLKKSLEGLKIESALTSRLGRKDYDKKASIFKNLGSSTFRIEGAKSFINPGEFTKTYLK